MGLFPPQRSIGERGDVFMHIHSQGKANSHGICTDGHHHKRTSGICGKNMGTECVCLNTGYQGTRKCPQYEEPQSGQLCSTCGDRLIQQKLTCQEEVRPG